MKKSIRLLGVLLLMMVFTRTLLAQTSAGANASSGDYRTHTTGNWSSSTTWETRDGSGNWTTPATPPTSANNIYVQNGHTLTVDGTVNCKDLHENTSGVIALGTNTLNVYGKIRAYTGTAVTGAASSDATFYSGQTNVGPAGTMFTVSSGLLQFVGSTRQLTFTGEWGTATASSNTLNINIALNDNSQTLTLGVGMKFNNITLSTGNLNAGNNAVNIGASGTLEIKSGTTFTTPRTAAAIVANSSSAKGGTFLIDAGGTLNLTGAAPLIDITTFTNNGTVSYTSTTAAQSLLAAGVVSGDASTATINSSYSTLIINNTYSTNTVTAATAVAVSSSLVLTAGTFDMGSNQLTGAFSINNTGAGTLKTSNASNPPIPNGLTFPTGTTVNYYGSSQPIATGNYNNLSLTTATGTTFPSGTVAIAGTFTPASIISASQGTINFTGSTQAIPVFNYYNLDLTNASGTTFPSGTVGISNTFTPASITSASQGTINLKGSTQSIPAFNYYSLDLTSATSTTFPSGTVGIANTFTPASITTASQGTINFNNATGNQTIPAFNYFNLTNSSTSTNLNSLAPTGTIGVAGTYTIAGSKGLSGTNSITYGSNATLAHTGSSCTLTSTTPEWPVINGPTNVNLNNSGSILYFPYSSINNFALTSNVATITTSSAHGFSVGQSVIISSIAPSSGAVLDGTFIITGVPTPNTFTFSKTNADITSTPATAGNANTTNLATITTVALTSNVATITTAANHGYSAGQVVTIENVSVSGAVFNGSYSITGVTSNTFSFAKTNANISATSATGLCTASSLPVVIVGEALTSNVATITTATAHGYSVNQNVTIANVSVNGTVFNGTYTITGVTTYTFTYAKTNANISFVAATGYAYVPTVTSIARAVPGTMYINGGTFTLGAGNMLVFGNGSTINRNTTGGKFNLSGGTYYFGSTSTDVVNLNINASVSTSGELPSTTTGKIALTVNGATYTLSGNASNCLKSVAFTGTTPIIDGVSLYNLSVYGDITGTGSFNNTTVTLAAGSTNVSGVSFSGLTLNNASGVTLSGNVSVSGTLLFTSGKITTGSNALTANGTVTGGGTGWVVGNLIKNIPSAATYTFEIGDASNYTPASLNVATVTTAGNVQVSTSSPLNGYTNFGTLKLNTATNYLNRYWTVTNPAGSSFAGAYTGTFTYVAGDLHNSRASFRTGIYNSGWTYGAANPGTLTEATPAGMTTGSTFVFADPIPLTITANNNSKTYGSSLTLNGSTGFTPTGLTGSDAISSVTLTSSGTVATAAATTYSIVPTAATGSAVTSGNYAIGYANGTLTVNQAPLTLTASVQSKTYGATTLSTTGALNSTYTVSGIQNSDVITVSLDYAGGDAATAAATTYTITPSATSATNYTITPVTGTLTVNKAPLSITANNRTKIAGNDITLGSTAFTTSGLVNSDAVTGVTLTSTGSGSGASAGAYDIVPSSASGTGLSNYNITYNNGTLTVSDLTAQTIDFTAFTTPVTYGSSTFDLSATSSSGLTVTFASDNSAVATVSGNTVTVVGAGTANIVASQSGDGSVWAPAPDVSLPLVVNKAALTIGGLTGSNKTYDRTTSASFTGSPYYIGLQNSESFSVTGTASASFATASVANGKTITITGYTAPSSNYTITQPSLSANITPVGLTISGITANNKVADGTNTATLSGSGSLIGVLSGDVGSVTLNGSSASATFSDAAVGTGKTVTVTGYTLTGIAGGNYTLTQPSGLTANITYPTSYYFVTASADITDANNWWSNVAGTGVHPSDFVTAGVTYNIYANTTTANNVVTTNWTVGGTGSVINLGNASKSSVTLTVASGFPISNTAASMNITAASSGDNSILVQDATTQPTFGTLDNSSEVHYQATMPTLIVGSTIYGKMFIEQTPANVATQVTFNAGTPQINSSLTVGTNASLKLSSGSTSWVVMNTGATATINGTIIVTKAAGFASFSVSTPASTYKALQFKSVESAGTTLVLNSGSTVQYARTNNTSNQIIDGRTDYKNVSISDGTTALYKQFSGITSIAGTLTVNLVAAPVSGVNQNVINANGFDITLNGSLVLTSGTIDMGANKLLGSFTTITGTTGVLKTSNASSNPIPSGLTWGTGTTVNYAGSGQSIVAGNYANLDLTGASSITFPSGTVGIAGTFIPGTITTATQGSIDFNNATGGQTIPAFNYYNLKSTNTSTGTANTTASTGTIGIANSFIQAGKYALNNGGSSLNYGSGATYNFNGTTSLVLTTTNPEWPATNQPANVTVNGQGSNTLSLTPATTSYSISTVALTNNVATITTSVSHSINVGDQITIGALASNSTYMFNGTYTVTAVTANTISYNLNHQDIAPTTNGSSAKVALSNISRTISGNFTIAANTFTIGAGNSLVLSNGATTIMNNSNSVFSYGGGYIGLGTSSTDVVNAKIDIGAGNTIAQGGEFNGVPAPGTYGTLTIASGTYQPTSSRTVNNVVNNGILSMTGLSSSGSFTVGNTSVSGSGSVTGSGTITASSATLNLNGNNVSANTISFTTGGNTLGTLSINRTGSSGALTLNSNLYVTNNLTLTAGTINDGGNIINVTGNITGTGTHIGTGKIVMEGVTKSIGAVSLNNLEINTSGSDTLSANLTVTGLLTLTTGDLTVGSHTFNLNGSAISVASGTLTTNTNSNLVFGGSNAGPLSIPSTVTSLGSLTINNTNATPAIVNLNSSLALSGLALTSGTLAGGSNIITNSGNITGTGTYTASAGGKILMTGNTKYSNLTGGLTLANVELNSTYGFKVTGTGTVLTITGNLNFILGNLAPNSNASIVNLTAGATITNAGASTGWVAGNLEKYLSSADTYNFEVGDAINYLPVSLNVNSTGFAAGSLSVGSFASFTTLLGTLSLDSTSSRIIRHWSVQTPAGSTFTGTYAGTFSYVAGDLIGSTLGLQTAVYNGTILSGTWSYPGAPSLGTLQLTTAATLSPSAVSDVEFANPASVTVSGITANKEYDGTSNATPDYSLMTHTGNNISINHTAATGSFADKNVGIGKTVTITGLTLNGTDANAYSIGAQTTTANISAYPLTVTAVTNSKVYDATNSAAATPSITTGSIQTGDVSNFIETYDNASLGTNKTLTPSGVVNDGNSGNNYTYSFVTNNTGGIYLSAYTWTGGTSTNWSTGSNWSGGSVPTSSSDVTLTTGIIRYPVLTATSTMHNLLIETGTTLSLNGHALTINGAITGTGLIVGSSTSSLTMNGSSASTLNFRTTTSNDTLIGTFTLSGTGKVTLGNGLGITKLLSLSNSAAVLDLNTNHLTLKSTSDAATAEVGAVTSGATITGGKVTVERYIPSGLRSFRDLGPTVYGAGSIFNNWQENGAYPTKYGMYITGSYNKVSIAGSYNPVTGADYSTTGNPSLYTYINNIWASDTLTKATMLDPFQGVRVLVRGARNYNLIQQFPNMYSATTLRATGTLVTGNVTFTTGGTSSASGATSSYGLTSGADAYSLIANPYACPIDWYSIYQHNNTNNNISSSYLYLDPTFLASGYNVYITYNAVSNSTNNPAGSIGSREYIQPGQGFFVQNWGATTSPAYADGYTTQLVISESDKVVGSTHTAVFGATKPNLLAISLWKNNNGTDLNVDGAVAVFNSNFTKNIGAEDSKKMNNSAENISITETNNDLSIDGLPTPAVGDVVALKLGQVTAGTAYQLKVDASNYTGLDAYIHDALMNTEVPANTTVSFTPTADAATYANRFSVVFKATKTMPMVNSGKLSVYPNPVTDKVVTVQTTNIAAGKYNVSMINNMGQTVLTTTINHLSGSTTETIKMNKVLPSGVYTMMLKNTDGTGVYQSELLAK